MYFLQIHNVKMSKKSSVVNHIYKGKSVYQTVSFWWQQGTCMWFTKKVGCANQLFQILKKGKCCPSKNRCTTFKFNAGISGFFRGSVLGQGTSEPQPSTGETQENINSVSRGHDMTEILLKAA